MNNPSFVYILTNYEQTTLYIGVTSNLVQRIFTHKEKYNEGFSKKYNLNKLVYYEVFSDIGEAISREKQLKGGSRKKKVELINNYNPNWEDLWDTIIG